MTRSSKTLAGLRCGTGSEATTPFNLPAPCLSPLALQQRWPAGTVTSAARLRPKGSASSPSSQSSTNSRVDGTNSSSGAIWRAAMPCCQQ